MPLKVILLEKEELNQIVEDSFQAKGKKVEHSVFTVNEETDKDIVLVTADGIEEEIEVDSLTEMINARFNITITAYEGYQYTEFAGNKEGFSFIIE